MTSIGNLYKEEYKSLIRLGLPVLVTQVGIIVVSFADTMMVGTLYGVDELAAAAFHKLTHCLSSPQVMRLGFAQGLTYPCRLTFRQR